MDYGRYVLEAPEKRCRVMFRSIMKTITLSLIGGLVYAGIELLWRGHTHWSMFLLAMFLAIPLDQINERLDWDTPIWLQAIYGSIGITAAELAAGIVLNLWLGLGVWDYSALPFNFLGQICLWYSLLWILLAGVGIVLFDVLRWKLFGERRPSYTWRYKKRDRPSQ